ncbi:MAG: hypothetical protein KDI22_01655 [Gammaproteobacteria bacterium]|nr:hypothetical protein [Gammaproteobacteria bacterium]MCP5317649.1 hypothetical protein [Chromatiaceae bacterium]MCW5586928.1 hypothetical protein [Chromatiales bacterium]MCB1818127.1 hypothetical protein [Gammaproteobacteria bacterium]MCP5430848.1 hypothetical protein [Chromatiaceae bacterium]
MRRELTPRRLHMGCGEGLTGRVPSQDRSGLLPRQQQTLRQAKPKAGKGTR